MKIIILLSFLFIQFCVIYKKNKKMKYSIPSLMLILYFNKIFIEKYIPQLDLILTYLFLFYAMYKIVTNIKKISIKNLLPMIFLLILMLSQSMFHWISGVYLNSLFYNGLLNITAITIILIYFVNFTSYEQLKDGFSVSKYTIYFLLVIALIDRYSYNLDRVGDLVNPNYIAYLCVIMLFYSNIFESKILNKSFIINLIITVIVLLLTQSNGGQLALLTSLSFSIFLFRKNKSIYYAYNFALVFLVIFSISTVINYNGEISWFLEIFIKESDSSRFFIWKETFKHFLKSPIMGTPYNTFRVLWNTELLVTHNDFLRILVELGLFGLTVFVLWIFQQLRLIYRFERNLLFSLSSLLWATLIFSLSHNNINNLLFWFSIVMPSLIYKLSKTNIKS